MAKKYVIALAAVGMLTLGACSSRIDMEVIKNDLRAPATPLVTIDPYTSAWSMTDNLYDSQVKHWSGHDFPLIGVVSVDGENYRFMGVEKPELRVVVPTSEQGEWIGSYTTEKPAGNWTAFDYDDSAWKQDRGAFGTRKLEPIAVTEWDTPAIWVRRTVEINEDLSNRQVILEFCNDDDAVFYINGVKIFSTGPRCHKNRQVELSDEARAAIRPGKNVLAAECINPVANGLLDFGLLTPVNPELAFAQTATQTSVDVQATQTHYTFTCGPVDLRLDFTAPMFTDDYESLSRPVNYITYAVKSNDGQAHDVKFYFEASPLWAINSQGQATESECFEEGGLVYLKSGSETQNILGKSGDHICIDWGYFYMVAPKTANTTYRVAAADLMRNEFTGKDGGEVSEMTSSMSFTNALGSVTEASNMFMIGYDDIYSIEYFGEKLRPYWNRTGDKTIQSQFELANKEYNKLYAKCYEFDREFMNEYTAAAGEKYAELCALAYRQTLAAHKLVVAPNGDLMYMSKENDSNGSIGTVDITYPTAPIFLYYNPELAKALMNHIFYYTESGKWQKDFPAHDVGTYPKANGQTYGGDMPIEEGGNMLIITAAVAQQEGNADYAAKHWDALTTWTDYLVQYGLDPENQLCTDDFAGHFAHNTNLSIKAIVGIASYGYLADLLGKKDVAEKYTAIARDYAAKWKEMASDGDHYRLTFDRPDTWSQKYNIVWDRLLGFNIFDADIVETEVAYYLTKQNKYGLPLDNRETYTKSDWVLWTATLDGKDESFQAMVEPLYNFYNETEDRVPMSDWVFTDRPHRRGFMTRAVVGGYWIKMLDEKIKASK